MPHFIMELVENFLQRQSFRSALSPVGLISGVVVGVVTVFLAAIPNQQRAKVSPISAVSGNVDIKSSVKHAIKFSLGKIDNSLGIHIMRLKKKNWFR